MNNNAKVFSIIIIIMFVLGCGEKIPIKEMSLAKMEISNAMSVMAKKYAPDEINEAEKSLLESHSFVKQDAFDKAKTAAIKSREKALEAYNKSIPLLAKDTLDIAGQTLEQAVEAYAEVLAEDEYQKASNANMQANELFEQKNYYPSYEKALEADGLAKEARNTALGKKGMLSSSIDEVRITLEEAETYNASTFAAEKVDAAKENLATSEQALQELQLKKGFAAVEVAGMNADEAYLEAIKETARLKSDGAEKLFIEAQNSDGAAIAKDELNASKEALDQSKALLEDSKYKESILSSEESERMSRVVLNAMDELAKEKIAGAEIVYSQAKESEGAVVAANQLAAARNALDLSKSLLEESKPKESIAQAAESERLSYIVINTRGKVTSGKAQVAGNGSAVNQDFYIYKVRYIPERRDCLWRIAEKYYDKGILWKHIYKANTDKINNPDLIWPDMLLKVPKLEKSLPKNKEIDADASAPGKEAVSSENTETK